MTKDKIKSTFKKRFVQWGYQLAKARLVNGPIIYPFCGGIVDTNAPKVNGRRVWEVHHTVPNDPDYDILEDSPRFAIAHGHCHTAFHKKQFWSQATPAYKHA